ncbi:MAG: hypothetical protein AB1632_10785, partial [Nitrospirota bacterium]
MRKSLISRIFLLLVLILGSQPAAFAEIFVHDNIAAKREEIMLKAETKGRYFSKGGQIVEFSVDGRSIGRVLSGGDGYAYKPFRPFKYGLHLVAAKYGKDKDTGHILSLRKGSRIVFIDVEGSLLSTPFSKEPIKKSSDTIRKIIKKYPVVYLHAGVIGTRSIREWLKKNRFPESVVLPWDMGSIFDEIIKKGFKIKAIIGSQAVIESAGEYKPLAFSFDEFDSAENVKNWTQIERKLN